MKKLILLACVLGLVSLAASHANASKWAGVKGGVNLADLGGDDVVGDTDMRTGFAGGAFFGWGISEQFGIQIEGLYMSKGASGKDDSTQVDVTLKVDYIEFPILFAARFPAGEKAAFNVFLGPTLGFNVSAKGESGGQSEDVKDDIKSVEFGATVGAGFYHMLESFSIVADVRYGIGATSIYEDFDGQSVDVKNRGIGIMAGVAFPIGSNSK